MSVHRRSEALQPGQIIRIHDDWPEEYSACHIRTPAYARGKVGRVEYCLGEFSNPEKLAFGLPAEKCRLYHVAFPFQAVWHELVDSKDEVLIEIYEHWMDAVEEPLT